MESAADLPARVERLIQTEKLISPGDGVVVAVSGGPDSVGLLHLLFVLSGDCDWRLTVAHVNHGFRGEESAREAEQVERLAERLRLPFEGAYIDVPRYIKETGKNAQAAARELRYAFLMQVAARTGSGKIAFAHHADDQAETVLMRLLRGTSPSGLSGIPMRRLEKNGLELIRPLLRINKSEIVQYCELHRLPYSTDSSNLENKYFRNQIRNNVLPYLRTYNERLSSSLVRLADVTSAEDDYLDGETAAIYEANVSRDNGFYVWSAKWFAGVHVALQRRLIKLILNYLAPYPDGIDFLMIEDVRTAIVKNEPGNFRRELGLNLMLTREYDRIAIHTMVLPLLSFAYAVEHGQERLFIPETGVAIEFRWRDGFPEELLRTDRYQAWFDTDGLELPLTIRSRQAGDRMKPYGLNGTKKVKDMFIDSKVPPSVRERIPVVADAAGRVLWIPGVRRSAHAVCTAATAHSLHMMLYMPEAPLFSMSR